MRQQPTWKMFSLFLFLFAFLFTTQVQASGAKRPDIETDGTTGIIENVPGGTDTTTGGGSTPSNPTTPTTPSNPTTPTPPVSNAYSHLDPEGMVPKTLLTKAVAYFDQNKTKIKNKDVLIIIDFKQHSSKERFFVIDMESGHVEKYLTAHGKGSDPNHTGYATIFSNQSGSNASSLGFYLTAETYYGSNGFSLKLDGLSSTNSNARARAVVVHGADYVTPGSKMGRSWGCPALEMRFHDDVINQIKGGALMYAERS